MRSRVSPNPVGHASHDNTGYAVMQSMTYGSHPTKPPPRHRGRQRNGVRKNKEPNNQGARLPVPRPARAPANDVVPRSPNRQLAVAEGNRPTTPTGRYGRRAGSSLEKDCPCDNKPNPARSPITY